MTAAQQSSTSAGPGPGGTGLAGATLLRAGLYVRHVRHRRFLARTCQ
ncbi:hypothetical protein MTO96_046203, partial [Rhipicephalus appendiculatus]